MTQVEAPADASTEDAKTDRRRLVQLIVAAVLIGVTGVMLAGTGVWALTFEGSMSNDLKGALNGHTLTSAGVLVLVLGLILLVCVVGVLTGPRVNRWAGLVARLAAIVVAAVAAFSGIWLVSYYPGWAVTYAALGALVVFTLTSYERDLHAGWPWGPLRAYVAKVFALKTKAVFVPRGVAVAGLVLVTLVATSALHQERYFLSVAFGLLFVALSDPGGEYLPRLSRTAVVGLTGALLTALGFAIGGGAWGWVVLAVFVVTVLSGLVINVDVHALVAGILLNVWFLVTLSAATGLPAGASTHPWNQALAWLIGAAIAIALMSVLWLIRDESRRRRSWLPEIPDDIPPVKLSRPIIIALMGVGVSIYAVNYAFYTAAIAGAVLIALDLPHPTNLAAEGRRIFYTFAGIAIAIVVMFLASLLQKRKAPATASQQAATSTGKDPAH